MKHHHAKSFRELAHHALESLKHHKKWSIVCGPISTGGAGCPEENLKIIKAVADFLNQTGHKIFDNASYEIPVARLAQEWRKQGGEGYCMPILEEFYLPIYKSGHIRRAFFVPEWESSFGSNWERKLFPSCNIEIVDLKQWEIDHIRHVIR